MGRTRVRGVGIVGPSSKRGHDVRKTKERAGREMTKVRASVWVLAVLAIAGLAAGCGQVFDRAKQEAEKKVENKGQHPQKEAKDKVNAKKHEAKKKLESGREDLEKKVNDLKKEVNGLRKDVAELQKKINAHEQKEQEQQINQLKKTLKELQKKVEAQGQQGQK
jgi:predicted RNase H-like nuclease (RuvC/YqgF family)